MNIFFTKVLRLKKVILRRDFYSSPQIKVPSKITLGNQGVSWTIIPSLLNNNPTIYSFGVGTDISFDLEVIKRFNAKVHAFDPTPKSVQWIKQQSLPSSFHFHPYGIASYNGKVSFTLPKNPQFVSGSVNDHLGSEGEKIDVPVKKLDTIMKELGHNKIDILKMDIEGTEYEVIDFMIDNNIQVGQLLVEFHHRFKKIGIKKSKEAIEKLNSAGYLIFHVSPNGEEYSFIHKSKTEK